MSGRLPTSPGFVATNFKINNATQTSTTFGGKSRRVGLGSTFYSFTVKYPQMTRDQAQPIVAFLASQYGMLDSFEVLLPVESYPRANYTGSTVSVTGGTDSFKIENTSMTGYAPGKRAVNVTGATANAALLKAGDFFKFNYTSGSGNTVHTKTYMAIADVTANSSGTATINFAGSAVLGIPNGTQLTLNTVPFTVILTGDQTTYETGIGKIYNMEFDVRELL